jgi:hypothetical protein
VIAGIAGWWSGFLNPAVQAENRARNARNALVAGHFGVAG